jgi:hypothetical protein
VNAAIRRPASVWLICLYCILSAVSWIVSLTLIFTGTIPLEAAQHTYATRAGILLSNVAITSLIVT